MTGDLAAALGVLAGALAVLVAGAVALTASFERHRVHRSVRVAAAAGGVAGSRVAELARPASSRLVLPGVRRLLRGVRAITPMSHLERLQRRLVLAGEPEAWTPERVVAAQVSGGVALGALVAFMAVAVTMSPGQAIAFWGAATATGAWAPSVVLDHRARVRQDEIRRSLPDALDLLSITVQAGLGFDAAVDRVARESGGALGEELLRTIAEIQLGSSRIDALRALGARSDVPEVRSFVLAMVQADVFGISIAQVLHVQADELRTRRRQFAEERAQKIPVKLVFPLIGCIMPSLFVVLLGPGALEIVNVFRDF